MPERIALTQMIQGDGHKRTIVMPGQAVDLSDADCARLDKREPPVIRTPGDGERAPRPVASQTTVSRPVSAPFPGEIQPDSPAAKVAPVSRLAARKDSNVTRDPPAGSADDL